MVVWHHAAIQIPAIEAIFPSQVGTSGVDLFFVISGFIMMITTASGVVRPGQFMLRRIIRVVPLYWLLTLGMVVVALIAPSAFRTLQVTPAALAQSLLFVPHFSPSFPTLVWPLLVPGWTLNFEMFFYLVFAVSLWLPTTVRLPAFIGVFAALVGAGFAFGPFESAAARTYTDPILLEFAAGTLIGAAWLRGRISLSRTSSLVLVLVGAFLLTQRNSFPLGTFTQMLGACLVITGALAECWSRHGSTLLRLLGDSSYSLYLTHLFTLGLLRIFWSKLSPDMTSTSFAIAYMAVSLVACAGTGYLSFRWIETPLLQYFNRITRRRSEPEISTSNMSRAD